ncbi:MAG: hypothetical protein KDD32_06690 [Bacteroidetes bacterium]|nr:hypothetical protein [Bacteroidota bacterium]
MPLEVKELYVKVSVNQAKSDGGEGSSAPTSISDAGAKGDTEKLAKDVVEQVLKIIDDKKER